MILITPLKMMKFHSTLRVDRVPEERRDLVRGFAECVDHHQVALDEPRPFVLQPMFFAEWQDLLVAQPSQVVSRDARNQMVDRLKLKAAVEPIHPGRALCGGRFDVCGRGLRRKTSTEVSVTRRKKPDALQNQVD